jgi:hypothetical protein
MVETLLVLLAIAVLSGLSLLAITVPPVVLAWLCLGLIFAGFLLGVPSGLYYHVLLRRELVRQGDLPKGWYWRPFVHHERLEDDALSRLRPWWTLGGVGFVLIVLALAISVVALVTQR